MFWKKKPSSQQVTKEACAHALYETLAIGLTKNGRIRAEDLIVAAASIAAELCIEAAGDFNPRSHRFAPGAPVFSTKINQLFCGDSVDIDTLPAESIVGTLRDKLLEAGYAKADFPSIDALLRSYAASVGKQSDWGKAPWSVPEHNKPAVLPLRIAYAMRSTVDGAFQSLDSQQKLRAALLTLAEALIAVQQVIDRKIALLLALETINAMAKTAPMTDEAMAAAKTGKPLT